jgi:hypothetical protein
MIHSNFFHFIHRVLNRFSRFEKNPSSYRREIAGASEGNRLIADLLLADEPCMISRFGSVELSVLYHYEKFKYKKEIFWKQEIKENVQALAGVFPAEEEVLNQFSKLYQDCSKDVDLLGVWFNPGENLIVKKYCRNAKLTRLGGLEPYYFENPWSRHLKHKKVLVIHPFEKSIKSQYQRNREVLFANKDILPLFTLSTIKAIQTIANSKTEFGNWFEALDFMQRKTDDIDFDVAIIGAGAYGLPLASYIKRKGKKAIHLGGATQILFGIKGHRWDKIEKVSELYNQYWKRPDQCEVPKNAAIVEGGCYW